ncbi:MAG: UvrD-helicase domain-containing protein [Lachnospiraceae bacterium]|nr:UvrD-helicase domain-containing protein [Lachnospiraceae bacterium]
MRAAGMTEDVMRSEIESKLDVNMFVEAGAGAGKTTLIIRRIINMLEKDVEPSEIVVITFTNAAAEELRSRIIKEVSERAAESHVLRDKLAKLSEMNISTIHSFCNVLLREQGIVAGLPLDIELIQNEDDTLLKKKYFDEYLSTLKSEDWDHLEQKGVNSVKRSTLRNVMEDIYMKIADLPEDTDIIIPKVYDPKKYEEALKSLDKLIAGDPENRTPGLEEEVVRIINSHVNKAKIKPPSTIAKNLEEVKENYCGANKLPVKKEIYEGLISGATQKQKNLLKYALVNGNNISFFSKSNYKALVDTDALIADTDALNKWVNSFLTDEFRAAIPEIKKADLEDDNITFEAVVEEAIHGENRNIQAAVYAKKAREYFRKNSKKNRISNDRLLEFTRDLILNDNKTALRYFAGKYKRYFVDEFQDTDRIQESFIYRLASEVDNPDKLRDGALFVVGDPKQSIYRFRGAQPAVYFKTKEKMEALTNAIVYELTYNFRSNKDLIDWVNKKFSDPELSCKIVDEGDVSYNYQPMEAKNAAALGEDSIISGVYHIGCPDPKPSETTTREADIKETVDLIKNLTKKDDDGNPYFTITDRKTKKPRPIEYSDFLLISQIKSAMFDYVSRMKQYDIPVILDGEEDLKADKSLIVYVRLYQYLVNPSDSFFRVGAEEALRETLQVKKEDELAVLTKKILDCLYNDTRSMSAYGMAEYLERQVSLLFDKKTAISKVNSKSSQCHIRQMIENISMNVTGTGIELAKAMQKYIDTSLEHELSLEESPDAVRFMNLHKTKGLEGEIVIILDRRGFKKNPVYANEGSTFYPGNKIWSSLNMNPEVMDRAKRAEAAEFHRLEYVAVTRAKQAVIFMDVIRANGIFASKEGYSYRICDDKNLWSLISETIPEDRLSNEPYKAENPFSYDVKKDSFTEGREVTENNNGIVKKESPSGLENGSSPTANKARAEAIAAGKKQENELNSNLPRPLGNVAGDILHRSMELIVGRKFAKAGISIDDSCAQAVRENRDNLYRLKTEMSREQVTAFMVACAKAYDRYLDSFWNDVKKDYPEVHFSYAKKDEDGETVWMNGTADLILEMNDGSFRLIDYKSDNDYLLTEEEMNAVLKEKYSPQLAVYRDVIQEMLGANADRIETGIISFSQKDEEGKMLDGDEVRVRYTKLI